MLPHTNFPHLFENKENRYIIALDYNSMIYFSPFLFILWEVHTVFMLQYSLLLLNSFKVLPNFLPAEIHVLLIQSKRKRLPKNRVWFLQAIYSWDWGFPWNVFYIPSFSPLKKANYYFPRTYHLEIASWIGVELFVYLSFKMLRYLSVFNLYRSCACLNRLWVLIEC